MSAENAVEVILPKLHPECASCVFAQRAVDRVRDVLPNNLQAINVECAPAGGGSRQVEPSKFVDHESRLMTITPVLLSPNGKRSLKCAEGRVPICPHFPIEGTEGEFPESPKLTWHWKDPWGRNRSGKLPY